MKVSGQLGKVIEKRLLLPAFLFNPGTDTQVVSEGNREAPIDMRYTQQVIDDVVYHLPAGYTVESAPQPAQLPWPDHAALVIKTQTGPGTIDIKHIYARAFVLLDAKEYPRPARLLPENRNQRCAASGTGAGPRHSRELSRHPWLRLSD